VVTPHRAHIPRDTIAFRSVEYGNGAWETMKTALNDESI